MSSYIDYRLKVKYASLQAMFNPLHSKMNQEKHATVTFGCQLGLTHYIAIQINIYLKSTSVIKVATMKNADNFLSKPSHGTTKSTFFAVSKDE